MATVTKFANANTVVTTGWTNPTNAYADDGVFATCAPAKNANVITDYGFPAFTTSDIPAGATINSLTFLIKFKSSTTGSTGANIGLQGNNNGTLIGSQVTFAMNTTLGTQTKVDTSGYAQADLQTANVVRARVDGHRGSSNTSITWSLDDVTLTVDFSNPVLVVPGVASLVLTGFAPTVTIPNPIVVVPGVLALALSEFAPTVATPRLVRPGVLGLTVTAFAPTVTATTGSNVTVIPGTLALTTATFAATVKAPRLVVPGVAPLTLTTFAPTAPATANQKATPGVLALALVGFAPTVPTPRLVIPGIRALSLSIFAPTVATTLNVTASPAALALLLAGYAPTVTGQVILPITDPAPYVGDADGAPPSKRPLVAFVSAQQQHQIQPVKVTRVPEWLLDAFLRGDIDEEEFTVLLALN